MSQKRNYYPTIVQGLDLEGASELPYMLLFSVLFSILFLIFLL